MSTHHPVSRARRASLAGVTLVLALLASVAWATTVSAHTEFVRSTPADGSTVDAPVSEIVIEFTGVSEPAGDGFVVLDPSGVVRSPTVTTTDDKVFRLAFDTPLTGGTVGVRWSVRAGDAHPIEGSFSFTVTADDASTPSTLPAGTATSDSDTAGPTAQPLDDFLRVDATAPGEATARVGRLVSFAASILAIGGLAFAATTMRGSAREVVSYLTALRVVGVVLAVGAVVEYLAVARLLDETWTSAWSRSAGVATLLRAVAGIAIAVGLVVTIAPRRRPRSLSAASPSATLLDPARADDSAPTARRWRPDHNSWVAFVGVGLAVISFWFDGHTVTKGFRPLHALANSVHVVAGSIWVAGVVSMAVLVWMRHRAGRPSDTAGLVVRFSSVATSSLGAVVIAGLVMAIAVLDSFDELTSTQWGQTLLLKTAAVAVALAIGTYNHFRLRPALEADPTDVDLLRTVRSALTSEAIILGFVVVVTVWLVAAAS
jgi:copper transport protein